MERARNRKGRRGEGKEEGDRGSGRSGEENGKKNGEGQGLKGNSFRGDRDPCERSRFEQNVAVASSVTTACDTLRSLTHSCYCGNG